MSERERKRKREKGRDGGERERERFGFLMSIPDSLKNLTSTLQISKTKVIQFSHYLQGNYCTCG